MKNANQKIIENNFHVLEKAVASASREEKGWDIKLNEAVRELRLYVPNVEYKIKEFFCFGYTAFGKCSIYRNTNLYNKKLREAASNINWEHI